LLSKPVEPGRHVRVDHAGRERLRHLAACTVVGCAPTSSAIFAVAGAVRAPFEALHVGDRVQRAVRVDALRRPRHRVEHHHPLLAELVVERLLRRLVELVRVGVRGREERDAVEAVERVLVLVVDQQDLAGLRLAALHGALDLGRP
jgi:hypothetical protein